MSWALPPDWVPDKKELALTAAFCIVLAIVLYFF